MHAFTHLDRQQHGTPEFPVEYYYVDHSHPRYQMPFHWHQEWELLRVLEGSMQIYLDDEQYALAAGDILLIRGGMLHGGTPCNCVYEGLVFDLYGIFRRLDVVKPYLRPFYRQQYLPLCLFSGGAYPAAQAAVGELMEAFRDPAEGVCRELETVAGLSRLFAWIRKTGCYQESTDRELPERSRVDRIKAVLEHIEIHFGSGIVLEDLAAIAGMNPKYFCRVFRSLTHYSPMDYVNFYRIEQAAYLLDSTELSITDVGTECGFWESSYFTKVFKKYKDMTPRQYRERVRGGQ